MSIYGLPVLSYFQGNAGTERPEFWIKQYFSLQQFWHIWSCLQLPGEKGPVLLEEDDSDTVEPRYVLEGFSRVTGLMEAIKTSWNAAWTPGCRLVIDESMLWWTGCTPAHKTVMPRKPTPLGFQMKTLVDGSSGILLNMELCDGKEVQQKKPYVKDFGATCACTLRLTERWWGTGREIIGDSWFGSVNTVTALL